MADAKHQSSEGGAPEYMVSYADMITIMMSFFVVLYATTGGSGKNDKGHDGAQKESELRDGGPQVAGGKKPGGTRELAVAAGGDQLGEGDAQLGRVFDSLHQRFGPQYTLSNCWTGGPAVQGKSTGARLNRSDGNKRGVKYPRGPANQTGMGTHPPEPGAYIVPAGRIQFAEGSAELADTEKPKLRFVAEELAGKSQRIEIRGHTSRRPLPPDGPFRDQMDLAYARCRAVEKELIALGLDPRRIRLGVAGDNEQADTQGDPALMQFGSRVEIHLLNEWVHQPSNAESDAVP